MAPIGSARADVAETQFREGVKLYDAEQYGEALQLFQLAWEHSHSPNARLYIAKCFLKLGSVVPAYDEFRGALQDATERLTSDPSYKDTQNAAAAELVLLEQRIGKLIVSLDATGVEKVELTLNGKPFPTVSLGEVVTVPPGPYEVVATTAGHEPVRRNVQVNGGTTVAVALWFPPLGSGPAPTPVPRTPDEPSADMSGVQIGGAVLLGLGGAVLLAAGATGIAAGSKFGALEDACGEGPCPDSAGTYNEVIDSGETFELVSYILLGAGGGIALAGGAMLIFGGDDAPSAEAIIVPLPGGAALSVSGHF